MFFMEKEKWYANPLVWIGVIVLVVLFYVVLPGGVREYDGFATCLSEAGATMYGTEWCGHCKDQKEMFGDSFDKVNFVDCDFQRDVCLIAGVNGYPTWKINGQNYEGAQPLEKLAELTGCSLVVDG